MKINNSNGLVTAQHLVRRISSQARRCQSKTLFSDRQLLHSPQENWENLLRRQPFHTVHLPTSSPVQLSRVGQTFAGRCSTRPRRKWPPRLPQSAPAALSSPWASSLLQSTERYDCLCALIIVLRNVLQEAVWTSWVVVYGYQVQPGVNLNAALLDRFKEYGVIERFSPSNGNWIFIKWGV